MGVDKVFNSLNNLNINEWRLTYKQYPNKNHFSTVLSALHDALSFLFEDFYEDGYELAAHKDFSDVLATFEKKEQL